MITAAPVLKGLGYNGGFYLIRMPLRVERDQTTRKIRTLATWNLDKLVGTWTAPAARVLLAACRACVASSCRYSLSAVENACKNFATYAT
jgi:hypothetical protein